AARGTSGWADLDMGTLIDGEVKVNTAAASRLAGCPDGGPDADLLARDELPAAEERRVDRLQVRVERLVVDTTDHVPQQDNLAVMAESPARPSGVEQRSVGSRIDSFAVSKIEVERVPVLGAARRVVQVVAFSIAVPGRAVVPLAVVGLTVRPRHKQPEVRR